MSHPPRKTHPLHPSHDGCNQECHRLAIERLRIETEIRVRLVLDGDDEHIEMLVKALNAIDVA